MSRRITAIRNAALGHKAVDFEDGTTYIFLRGEHEKLDLKVGDLYPPEEKSDAVGPSDAQVENGQPALGQQERAEGEQPEAGSGDHVVGEAGGEEGQAGVQDPPQDGPAATSQE